MGKDWAPSDRDHTVNHREPQAPTAAAQSDAADVILKFAALRDQGVLSEEEFQAKKRELLGLSLRADQRHDLPQAGEVGSTPTFAATPAAPAVAKKHSRWSKKKIALAVVAVLVVASAISNASKPGTSGAPAPAPASAPEEWTVAGWTDRFLAYGFSTPTDSPLTDGTPRKMMRRESDSAATEAIGNAHNLDRVSLIVGASGDTGNASGELLGAFLNTYAPGTRQQVVDGLGLNKDYTVQFAGGSVHVITLTASDGVLVTVTVDRS